MPKPKPERSRRPTLFGWWYLSIGAGFVLLAVNRLLVGDVPWLIGIRFLIGAGFFLLGYLELKRRGTSGSM